MSDYDGLTALVTGGASGIGAATARLLAARGARVAVIDRTVSGDSGFLELSCDVTDRAAVHGSVAEAVTSLGGLDVLVNNAGIGAVGDVSANDDAAWAHVLDVNVVGIARVSAAALPHLRRSEHAAIVNVSSVVAVVGVPQRALYSASKGAVAALTLAMAADHVRDGIRVNAVLPGTADTPWVSRLLDQAADPAAAADALRARQPLGRLVAPEEIAQSIAHLASPLSASTTGTLLGVDGGMAGLRLPA
jgi:2-keto-3-deoxy-L-fuconate dehydrogenase